MTVVVQTTSGTDKFVDTGKEFYTMEVDHRCLVIYRKPVGVVLDFITPHFVYAEGQWLYASRE